MLIKISLSTMGRHQNQVPTSFETLKSLRSHSEMDVDKNFSSRSRCAIHLRKRKGNFRRSKIFHIKILKLFIRLRTVNSYAKLIHDDSRTGKLSNNLKRKHKVTPLIVLPNQVNHKFSQRRTFPAVRHNTAIYLPE